MSVLLLQLTALVGLSLADRHPPDYRADVARRVAAQASALNAQGHFDKTIRLVRRFERTVEVMGAVSYEAAYAHNRLGAIKSALKQYSTAITADPDLAAAYYDRGEIYLTLDEVDQARADFEAVVRLRTDHWAGHFRLAHVAGIDQDPIAFERHLMDAIRFGFDFAQVASDPSWRSWAVDETLGPVIRKLTVLYGDENVFGPGSDR